MTAYKSTLIRPGILGHRQQEVQFKMPPRAQHRDPASDAESKSIPTSRSANKARNAVAVAAQQELLSKHIHSNGPHDKPRIDVLDFNTFDDTTLERYNRKLGIECPAIQKIDEDILRSDIGKKTYTARNSSQTMSISKPEMASFCQKHFINSPCRENEIISNFLYKVKNDDKEFKLTF